MSNSFLLIFCVYRASTRATCKPIMFYCYLGLAVKINYNISLCLQIRNKLKRYKHIINVRFFCLRTFSPPVRGEERRVEERRKNGKNRQQEHTEPGKELHERDRRTGCYTHRNAIPTIDFANIISICDLAVNISLEFLRECVRIDDGKSMSCDIRGETSPQKIFRQSLKIVKWLLHIVSVQLRSQ